MAKGKSTPLATAVSIPTSVMAGRGRGEPPRRATVIVCGNGAALPEAPVSGKEHGVPFR
jgi:hypothetical protein